MERLYSDSQRSSAGIHVTPENAFTFSAVYDAVNQISSDVAKLPLNLHKRRADGGSDHYLDSKVYWLLKHEPNPEMGSMVFRRTLQAHALTWHGGYAEIERDGAGRPVALWPITPDRIEPFRREMRDISGKVTLGALQYRVDGHQILDARDVIHIHGLGWNGHQGYAVINLARHAIGMALAMEQFGSAFFRNGSTFGGILSAPNPMDAEERKGLQAGIEGMHQSAERAFRFLLLDGGLTYQQIGVDPDKAQMNQSRDKQVEEVARFFNMPLHKLKSLERATNNNIEQQDLEYYKGCLMNWVTLWEEELSRKLISPLERRQQFIKHNANAFLRGDIKSRYDALGIARDKGVISADEWRELEDMNPQDGGHGKLYLVQSAQVPLGSLQDLVASQIEKNKQKPEPPQAPAREDNERMARAEAAVAEAQDALTRERHAREAAEQDAGTTREALAVLTEREQAASDTLAALEVVAADLRADVARRADVESELREAVAAAQTEAVAAEAARVESDRQRTEAVALADSATVEREQAVEALQSADQRAMEAQVEAERLTAAADEARTAAGADLAATRAACADAEAQAATAREAADALAVARDAAAVEARDAAERERVALEQAATYQQVAQDAAERVAALAESLGRTEADLDAARAEVVTAREQASQVQAERDAATAQAQEAATALATRTVQAQAEVAAAHAEESDRVAAVVSAHRALVVDIMRRMIERECDRARRAQTTPEKLAQFLGTFYEGHEDLCRTALLPAVRVHLAWIRSSEDPVAVTRRLARQHVEESTRQIRTVLDGDADEMSVSLNSLLRRWETERVSVIADALMEREIDHARTR